MNREEYMGQLAKALEVVDKETAADILEDYAAHFDRAIEAGHTEDEVIAELGGIEEFVEELKQFTTPPKTERRREAKAAGQGNAPDGRPFPQGRTGDESAKTQKGPEAADKAGSGTAGENTGWAAGQGGRDSSLFGETIGKVVNGAFIEETIGKAVNGTAHAIESGTEQLSHYLDKASEKFGEWFSGFEKTDENREDYHARQERAKYGEQGRKQGREKSGGYGHGRNYSYSYQYKYTAPEEAKGQAEEYMSQCHGSLGLSEGIHRISVDAKTADIRILPSPDAEFHYNYRNDGSEGSKAIYRLCKRVSKDTLFLNVVKNERTVQRKNHFGILGNFFSEETDISLDLQIPSWMESLNIDGSSGDVTMEGTNINVLQVKSISGDITLNGVNVGKCMVETTSGEVKSRNGSYEYVLFSSQSGDVEVTHVNADKAAFRSQSGDVAAVQLDVGEAVVSSMSGDARAERSRVGKLGLESKSGDAMAIELDATEAVISSISGDARAERSHVANLSLESKSGDTEVKNMESGNLKLSSISGDAWANGLKAKNVLVSAISGDIDIQGMETKAIKASSTSGDISLRGSAGEYALNSISGDIIVVQNGDTNAQLDSKSGDVHFHLKNNNAGFIANLKTHGDINFRYGTLCLENAGNGQQRYGMEGSSLEIKLISGDITITD